MPLREINQIELGYDMYINYTMRKTYGIEQGDTLVCEVLKHFGSNKKLANNIGKKFEVKVRHNWINIATDMPGIVTPYNIKEGDFLEVVYTELKKDGKTVEIFPGETKEYLDFNSEEF